MHSAIKFIELNGGEAALITPLNSAIGYINPAIAHLLEGKNGIKKIYYTKISPEEIPVKDFGTESAIYYWNQSFEPKPVMKEISPDEITLRKDTKIPVEIAAPPGLSDTLKGKVAVSIFFPESNGAIDSSKENWTNAMVNSATAGIQSAMSWWNTAIKTQAPWMDTLKFFFNILPPDSCPVSYEPITRSGISGNDTELWINELMNGRAAGANTREKVYNYNKIIKEKYDTKWAFTIFVINDLNDADKKFSDSSFAFAYEGGPYAIVTYENNGWGRNRMQNVVAHETGHIFRAPDEYASAPCDTGKYVNFYPNYNCRNGGPSNVNCVMFHNDLSACFFTQGHIGWAPGPYLKLISVNIDPPTPVIGDTAIITITFKNTGHSKSDSGVIRVSFPQSAKCDSIFQFLSPDNSKFSFHYKSPHYNYIQWYDPDWDTSKTNQIKIKAIHKEAGAYEIFTNSIAKLKGWNAALFDPEKSSSVDQKGSYASSFTYDVLPSRIEILSFNEPTYKFLGSDCPIEWTTTNLAGDVNIILCEADSGSVPPFKVIDTIATTAAAQNLFNWIVPNDLIVGKYYYIKISSKMNNAVYDTSDNFIIPGRKIAVTYPNGFEGINAGDFCNITWNTTGINANVQISLIPEINNVTSRPIIIAPLLADQGTFRWKVPNDLTEWAKIEIKQVEYHDNIDTSDNRFFINNLGGMAWVVYNNYCGSGADSIPGTLPWTTMKLYDTQNQADRIVFGVSGNFVSDGGISIPLYDNDAIDGSTANGGIFLYNASIWLYGSNTTVKNISINNQNKSSDYGIVSSSYSEEILSGITITGNVISGCSRNGISLYKTNHVYITENKIGTDPTGMQAVGNGQGISLLWSDSIIISNNIISGNRYEGIWASSNRVNNLSITNNIIGLNSSCTDTLGNGSFGIIKSLYYLYFTGTDNQYDENVIIQNNIIAGNGWKSGYGDGISIGHIQYPIKHVVIKENYLGIDSLGRKALGNNGHGISFYNIDELFIGSNVISANNQCGIYSSGILQGVKHYRNVYINSNIIGLTAQGDSTLGNKLYGIEASINNSEISYNTISGNLRQAIYIHNTYGVYADSNRIKGNKIGTDIRGSISIPNYGGLYLASDYNMIEGDLPYYPSLICDGIALYGDYNNIRNNYLGLDNTGTYSIAKSVTNGIYGVAAHHNKINGNIICGFNSSGNYAGIKLLGCSYNEISYNRIGLNKAGSAVPNRFGIFIDAAYEPNNGNKIINNVIAGNSHIGIYLRSTTENEIQKNLIGVDLNQMNPVHNGTYGIKCENVTNTVIGGIDTTAANTISDGIYLQGCSKVNIASNYLGTNSITSKQLGNSGVSGIHLAESNENEIKNNIISGNGKDGATLEGSDNNKLLGNKIGANNLGNAAIPNLGSGIKIVNGSSNFIGDDLYGNVIAGNDSSGIHLINADSTDVRNNTVGGFNAENGTDGVCISGSSNYNELSFNQMAYNKGNGVTILDNSKFNLITQCSFYNNDNLGIDLNDDGVTPNDENDLDDGPNDLLNFPVITNVEESAAGKLFSISGEAQPGAAVELFLADYQNEISGHGEGKQFLGSAIADQSGKFILNSIPLCPGSIITATASINHTTSEFASNFKHFGLYPDISISDTNYDFGEVYNLSSKSWDSLLIQNHGDAVLGIQKISFARKDSMFAVDSTLQFPIFMMPGNYEFIKIYFLPKEKGKLIDTLIVYSNDPDEPILIIRLEGFSRNNPPTQFTLTFPEDNSSCDSTIITFIWNESKDIDNDVVNYGLYLKGNDIDTLFSPLTNNYFQLNVSDLNLPGTLSCSWNVHATDDADITFSSDTRNITIITDVLLEKIPDRFDLEQNYPNPFNFITVIKYSIPERSSVSLDIFDILGRKLLSLVNEEQDAGYYKVNFSIGYFGNASAFSSGIYFYRLKAGKYVRTFKMILLR